MMAHEVKEKEEELAELRDVSTKLLLPFVSCSPWNESSSESSPSSIVVHWVRHGQAEHNAFATRWREEGRAGNCYVDPACPVDPNLTEKGRADAIMAGKTLKERLGNRQVSFASSPMRRTLETCFLAQKGLEDLCVVAFHGFFLLLFRTWTGEAVFGLGRRS